jgi:hypothetical protein
MKMFAAYGISTATTEDIMVRMISDSALLLGI